MKLTGWVIVLLLLSVIVYADCDNDIITVGDEGIMILSTALHGNLEDTDKSTADTVETTGCCGDYSNEWLIKMNDFYIVEVSGNNSREKQKYTLNYACCDDDTDCVYKGRCYGLGQTVTANPRYACGPSNYLIEALDYDYATTEDPMENYSVKNTSYVYSVQEKPSVNPYLISCNSNSTVLPQQWTSLDDCSNGTMRFRIVDGSSGNVLTEPAQLRLELFKLAGYATKDYTNYTFNTTDDHTYNVFGLLASYYNVLVTVGGYMGTLSTVRVDYDEDSPTIYTIQTYRDNTCYGCVDYSIGGGLCNADCEGRGIGILCNYSTTELAEKCHLHAPGNEIVLDNNSKVECCNRVLEEKLPDKKAKVSCDKDHLVKKEYTLQWRGTPIKMIVSVCGE